MSIVSGPAVELWGGAELTCNRVGNRYFDQTDLSGHGSRLTDLKLFSQLGIKVLRCGVLWERHAREGGWNFSDMYLEAVRAAAMRPIVGLLHHGSGPPDTHLLDPEFPQKLAAYAGKVAARYPWVDAYTPINEPHTTARFACRYGVWYPHMEAEASYLRALFLQMKGVVLSMQAIREVRPDAQLVQTDDLGRIWSTPELGATAALFNERRWLPFDLLCGTVDQCHPIFDYLRRARMTEREILWFRDNPCPPATIGVNYYVTSDRYLDQRLDLYPDGCRSAEGPFVDISAVRVRPEGIQGFESILHEAYLRYRLPVAITEVHLGASVEEQIRWAADAWNAAVRLREAGVPCQAVTFWALLGSFFWNALVTSNNGHYEPGVFDMRGGSPVPTALADLVRQCARGGRVDHPALGEPGWWQRANRLEYFPDPRPVDAEQLSSATT